MTDREAIRARVQQCPEASQALVLVSEEPISRLYNMLGQRVHFPPGVEQCFVALVDPTPSACWAHPAWWAFVTDEILFQPTMYPSYLGEGHPRFT